MTEGKATVTTHALDSFTGASCYNPYVTDDGMIRQLIPIVQILHEII